jgi:hypothetical protein
MEERDDTIQAVKPLEGESQPEFLTARGIYNTKINSAEPYQGITLREIIAGVSNPASVPKDQAPFAIFSTYREFDGRKHEVQREKGEFYALAGDIDKGNPSLDELDTALVAVFGSVECLIYSSASATAEQRKWRYIITIKSSVFGTKYRDTQRAAFALLLEQGITCDSALERTGQPVFLPNIPEGKRDPKSGKPLWYQHRVIEGDPFCLAGSSVLKRRQKLRKAARRSSLKQARKKAKRLRSKNKANESPIVTYNRLNPVEVLANRYGYVRKEGTPHWRSPNQQSESYATKIEGDYWVSLSGSDAQARIGCATKDGHRYGDAFDMFSFFEHKGNGKAAIAALLKSPSYKPVKNARVKAACTADAMKRYKSLTTTVTSKRLRVRPTPRELIAGLFPARATSAVVAPGGVGKTSWLVYRGIHFVLSEGNEVLFISGEDTEEDYQTKIHNAVYSEYTGKPFPSDTARRIAKKLHILNLRGLGEKLIEDSAGSFVPSGVARDISQYIHHKLPRVRMVVFETVSRFAGGGEDNDRMEAIVSACDHIATKINGAVVLVHHTGKTQARDKIVDLYSGRGGSALGDNTRCMIVLTRIDDKYHGQRPIAPDKVDVLAGRVFEVSNVRNSYASTASPEYFVTRQGQFYGPVLEPLPVLGEGERIGSMLNQLEEKKEAAVDRIIKIIKEKGGEVPRKFFDMHTRNLIDVTQAEGREIIKGLLEIGVLVEVDQKEGRTTRKTIKLSQCE